MSLPWIIYLELLPFQTFLIKTNINWGLRNEIRLLYQPRNQGTVLLHTLLSTSYLLPPSSYNNLVGSRTDMERGETKRSRFCFVFGKTSSPKWANQKVQNMNLSRQFGGWCWRVLPLFWPWCLSSQRRKLCSNTLEIVPVKGGTHRIWGVFTSVLSSILLLYF